MATFTRTDDDSPGDHDTVNRKHKKPPDLVGRPTSPRQKDRRERNDPITDVVEYCRLAVSNAAQVVDLSNQHFGTTGIVLLRNAIAISSIGLFKQTKLRRLVLVNIGLTDSKIPYMADTMAQWVYRHKFQNRHIIETEVGLRIESIDLSHNQITSDGANMLLDMIYVMPHLRELTLDGNPCKKEVASIVSVVATIEHTLSTNRAYIPAEARLGDSSSQNRQPWTQHAPSPSSNIRVAQPFTIMEQLELSELNLGDQGVDHLLIALRHSDVDIRIKSLVLTGNSISAVGGSNIANFLTEGFRTGRNFAFQVLQLDYNHLGSQGVTHLAHALAGGARVSSLFVARNDCGDGGAMALATAVRLQSEQSGGGHVFPLASLSVLGNNITTEGARSLASVYLRIISEGDVGTTKPSHLSILHLGDNVRIGDAGAMYFAQSIREFLALQHSEQRRVTATTGYWGSSESPVNDGSQTSDSYLSLWRCGVTNLGARSLVDAAEPAFTAVINEAAFGGGRLQNICDGGPSLNGLANNLTETLVELDLEWNVDVTSDELRARLQEMERLVGRIQQSRV